MDTKAKSTKFCIGAIFMLLYLLFLFNYASELTNMLFISGGLENAFTIRFISTILLGAAIIGFSVIAFMKRSGIPLALVSLFFALTALIYSFSLVYLYYEIDLFNSPYYYPGGIILAMRYFYVFSFIMLFFVFLAIGLAALLHKYKTFFKAMKITSLICAICFAAFDSISYSLDLINSNDYYKEMRGIFELLFAHIFFAGVILSSIWATNAIESQFKPYVIYGFEDGHDAYQASEAPVAMPAFSPANPIPTVSVFQKANVASSISAATAAPTSPTPAPPIAVTSTEAVTPAVSVAPAFSVASANEIASQLKIYKELLDSGIITQEEFDAKKKEIL